MRFSRIVIAAISALLAVLIYLWGIPALTEAAASRVPVTWEERLGQAVVEQLAPAERRCNDPERTRVLEQILAALLAEQPASRYRFTVTVVDDASANAFAVPGGQVVIFHGLLVKAESAEELAGVLAHEVEHIRQRHSLKAVFRGLSLRAVLAIVTGSGLGMGPVLEAAGMIGSLQYQRADEEAADLGGMQMVQAAQIDPMGIVRLLRRLDENSGPRSPSLGYLSTHPLTQDRTNRLRQLADQSPYTPVLLLPDYAWQDIEKICRPAP